MPPAAYPETLSGQLFQDFAIPASPYMALLRVGFAVPLSLPKARWALTPPFHPYRLALSNRRSLFCCTLLEVTLTGRYPALCPTKLGLSSREQTLTGDCLYRYD